MRIIASIVTKDETSRYFQSMLEHNNYWWDDLFVYDDRSSDDTVTMARKYTDHIALRSEQNVSFLDHEAQFRTNALLALEASLNPTPEIDWIFAIDADEFLFLEEECTLTKLIEQANVEGKDSIDMRIPEIWRINHSLLYNRTDGFWNTMSLPRLYRYKRDWEFRKKPMGCGSGPIYTYNNALLANPEECHLLHVGYANESDRVAKHKRYTSLENHGHNPRHIQSIIETPELVEYDYEAYNPKIWRGKR